MSGRIRAKWRPSLALILSATVGTAFLLPALGIMAARWVGQRIGYLEAQIIFGVIIFVFAALLVWVLWRILYGPISALSDRADAIAAGEPEALRPLDHYGTREMRSLGQAMLDMGRVLQGREAVIRSYADHATHELKSPLTAVRGAAELLAEGGLSGEDQQRLIDRIEEAAARMADLLEAQRRLARAQDPLGQGSCLLSRVVKSITDDHAPLAISTMGEADLPIPAEGLAVVLSHLFGNALTHGATEITVQATGNGFDVNDNGPGISDGNRKRVFDPFFTTRRADGGTGMGLAIVRRMLEAHGGEITLGTSAPGASFHVRF